MPSSSSVTPWKPLAWIKVFFLGKLGHSWNISAINFQSHSISMLSHRYLHADRFLWITCTLLWSGIDRDRCIVHLILINTRKQRIQPTQNKNSYTIAFRFPLKPLLGWGKRWKHVPIFIRFLAPHQVCVATSCSLPGRLRQIQQRIPRIWLPCMLSKEYLKMIWSPLKIHMLNLAFLKDIFGSSIFFLRGTLQIPGWHGMNILAHCQMIKWVVGSSTSMWPTSRQQAPDLWQCCRCCSCRYCC